MTRTNYHGVYLSFIHQLYMDTIYNPNELSQTHSLSIKQIIIRDSIFERRIRYMG